MSQNTMKQSICYIVLVLALTLLGNVSGQMALVAVSQAAPLIAVIILLVLFNGRKETLADSGIARIGKLRWYVIALLSGIPIIAGFAAAWTAGIISLPDTANFPPDKTIWDFIQFRTILAWGPQTLIMTTLFSFGEEIGWRGYLQPKLTKQFGVKKAILTTAAVWAVFHYPFYMNGYNTDGNLWITIGLFTIAIVPMSVFIGWVRYKSESLWPVVIIHAMINLVRSWLEMLFLVKQPGWSYFAGESGVITIAVWGLIGFFLWRLLSKQNPSASLK